TIEETERTITDATGKVVLAGRFGQKVVKIGYGEVEQDEYRVTKNAIVQVADGDTVVAGQSITETPAKKTVAKRGGIAKVDKTKVTVVVQENKVAEYLIPAEYSLMIKNGDLIAKGDRLTDGSLDLHTLYRHQGRAAVQNYMLKEIQHIYSSQGQKLNDKHVEIIIRQMFSRVHVTDAADTELLPGEITELSEVLEANAVAKKAKKTLAVYQELFLGISKVSLSTTSWLSAASFQETARVLIDAAVTGKIDRLEGLKENVIIGRLVPAGTGFDLAKHGSEASTT
ncbi:MAG: DNA-directed RNA polymerase subunit beta', partial [Patescibacteria group bacterium]